MFQFADSSRHKILRVLTYHPRGFDLSVLSESISSKRRSRATRNIVHFNPPSTFATLGDLNAFPIELLNEILRYSDLYTISMFSLLNRQARTIVHASLPYKHLLRHAPRALVALIRTGASHFTMDKVFQAFCSPSSLRQLWSISLDPGVYPVLFLMFADGSRTHANGRKPSKGGIWAHQEVTCKSPHCDHLTSRASALQVATMTHGGEQGLAKYMESSKMSHGEATSERPTAMVDHVTRFMATIPFPYFDPTSRTTHIGLACQGCKRAFDSTTELTAEKCCALTDRRDRTYTEMGFFEHLEHCREAQRLWKAHRRTTSMGSKK